MNGRPVVAGGLRLGTNSYCVKQVSRQSDGLIYLAKF